jgi:hypothetical protein
MTVVKTWIDTIPTVTLDNVRIHAQALQACVVVRQVEHRVSGSLRCGYRQCLVVGDLRRTGRGNTETQ